MTEKERAIRELKKLSEEQAGKVLIFMAGLEAGRSVRPPQEPAVHRPTHGS